MPTVHSPVEQTLWKCTKWNVWEKLCVHGFSKLWSCCQTCLNLIQTLRDCCRFDCGSFRHGDGSEPFYPRGLLDQFMFYPAFCGAFVASYLLSVSSLTFPWVGCQECSRNGLGHIANSSNSIVMPFACVCKGRSFSLPHVCQGTHLSRAWNL